MTDGIRQVPLDEPLHMPAGRVNLCNGQPYVTRLLEVDFDTMGVTAYPMCPACWSLVMAGADTWAEPDPLPIDTAAAPPKEIRSDDRDDIDALLAEANAPKAIRAQAERLDQPRD